jgi:NACHT domain- and WD repeat-containing protein
MPHQTKIFRVFISSTFTDMRAERSILQKDAFPRLEKFCEENGARFQAVDLRWGVNEESALNQKTLQICFNEIERCQRVSPKPNFLILLGDKYGWQPVPEIIPEDEMMAILAVLEPNGITFIENWYRRDENAVPPEYVLQPRGDDFKEYARWEPVEADIRSLLRLAVNQPDFTPEQKYKYFASATHQEILKGALHPGRGVEDPRQHVYVYSRTIHGLPNDATARAYLDFWGDMPDKESRSILKELKDNLLEKIGKEHFIDYKGDWENDSLVFKDETLQNFSNDVYEKLKKIISDQLENSDDKDEVDLEVKLHREFKKKLTEHFRGRGEILASIESYLNNHEENKPFTLIGASGSGKSSVMAQAVKLAEEKQAAVVFRFIGATSRSSNIMSLLQSLCSEIARKYGTDAKTLAREGDDKAWYDIYSLSEIFRKCLALATHKKPLFVFLDSLDQLSDTDNAKALYWLPKEVPEHARVVVSSLPEREQNLCATSISHLDLLPEKEADEILDQWFASAKRKLTDKQKNYVIQQFAHTKLPIYLKLAFEQARKWHSYDPEHTLSNDVPGIINNFFERLEREYPKDFVKTVVCYMLSGRYQGLTENEILEILAFDEGYWKTFIDSTHHDHRKELNDLKEDLENRTPREYMKIPISVWSRFYLDMESFLTERDADGVPIITFFHRQFNEVLRERHELTRTDLQN